MKSHLKILTAAVLGLFAATAMADAPATATWTGGGNRAVLNDHLNWSCKDASGNVLPGEIPVAGVTAVTISGNTNFTFPTNSTPIWKSIAFGTSISLTDDCDWRGLGSVFDNGMVASDTTINLKGHELYAKMPNNGNTTKLTRKITVTDDSAQGSGGRFHMDVAQGAIFKNTTTWNKETMFWFTGTMELVKDGTGRYIPHYPNDKTGFLYYTYTGGTTIHEGLLELYNDGEGAKNETYYAQAQSRRPVLGSFAAFKPFIRIDAGATVDYKGVYYIDRYQTYLNGGTIKNTRMPRDLPEAAFGDLTFEADSFFDIARTAQQGGYFYLNGHTLTVNIAANQDWYCLNGSGKDGTIIIRGDGVFHSYKSAIVAPTVNFDIATAINMEQPMSVSNYVSRTSNDLETGHQGAAALNVYGTFTPVTDFFYGCTMQDGSTIDLSARTDIWSVTSRSPTGKRTVDFEPGAEITVIPPKHSRKIIDWEGCAPADTVKFKMAPGSFGALTKTPDGLYLFRGLMLIAR